MLPLFKNNNYLKKQIKEKMKKILIIIFTAFLLLIAKIIMLSNELKTTKQNLNNIYKEYNEYIKKDSIESDELSKWDIFTLALMKVESNYDSSAVSSVGAKGYFQITPIYVKEVNRVHCTNYKYDDVVKSFDKSYEVFMLMQEAHNQEYNMDEALKLHNGDHKWYRRRVYKEMESIEKYEKIRQMLRSKEII